jgi:hypothetical protein
MTNFNLYRLLNLIVNKDIYANAISGEEFELQLKAKNILLFTSKLPSDKSLNTQQIGVGVTRMSQHDLSPFLIDDFYAVSNIGMVDIPGLYYVENFYSPTNAHGSSELISLQEVSGRLKSYIKPPTATDLVVYVVAGGLKILNVASGNIHVLGYRLPTDPVFVLTTNEGTLELEYDETESTELEWNDGCKLDILHLILQDMGVTIERQEVTQLANKLIVTGK